jgi:hypothetical protein
MRRHLTAKLAFSRITINAMQQIYIWCPSNKYENRKYAKETSSLNHARIIRTMNDTSKTETANKVVMNCRNRIVRVDMEN